MQYDPQLATYAVKDLDSINGTYVNSHKIDANIWCPLDDQDVVSFGGANTVRRHLFTHNM